MRKLIETVITDASNGDLHPLIGLIDWLVAEKGCNLVRLVRIAERRFKIPQPIIIETLHLIS